MLVKLTYLKKFFFRSSQKNLAAKASSAVLGMEEVVGIIQYNNKRSQTWRVRGEEWAMI